MEKEGEKDRSRLIVDSEAKNDYGSTELPGPYKVGGAPSVRQSSWLNTAFLLLAEVIGTGVLALPSDMAKLGWTLGIVLLLFCFGLNLTAGILLWRIQHHHPGIHTYSDAAGLLFGPTQKMITHVSLVITLFLIMANYLLVLSLTIEDIFYKHHMCRTTASAIAAGVLLVPSQQRTLHYISFTSVASVLSVLVVLGLCLHEILGHKCSAEDRSEVHHVTLSGSSITFLGSMSALSSFVFASGGQMIYLEMISEMKKPQEFPKALMAGLVMMMGVYFSVALVSYHCLGDSAPSYLLEALPTGTRKQVASGFMAFHVIVSYTLHQQVLTRKLHVLYGHHVTRHTSIVNHLDHSHRLYVQSQLQWLMLSVVVVCVAWVIANTIPFFGDLVALVGSLTQSLLFYVCPAVFFAKCAQMLGDRLPGYEKFAIVVLVVFGFGVFGFGTYSNLHDIAKQWSSYGAPFSC